MSGMGSESHTPGHFGRRWLRRVGVAGFVFFLAKGLLWLGVGVAVLDGCRTD